MKHIEYASGIDIIHRRLPFFLATEEWVARYLPRGEYFFSWQVDPTVICGRNQEINKEVDLEFCLSNGIDVVRRKSGGGAVFADRDNFMFSFITFGDDVIREFARYTSMIAEALRHIGVAAEATGRNDITIDGKKVSGNAFYHLPGRCIAHGTMLYDFDSSIISRALTPSKAKLESKGVKSVPMRVTSLRQEGISLSPCEFEKYMIDSITDSAPFIIGDKELKEIESIEQGYYDPSFIRIGSDVKNNVGKKSDIHINRNSHIPGVGEFSVDYSLDSEGRISDFHITGDFFMKEDVESVLCSRLNGVICSPDSLLELFSRLDPASFIPGLETSAFLELIVPENSIR